MADPQQPARRASHTPVAVFAVDSGGCGACVQSILALQSTRYAKELHAARVSFAQAPRQADVLLISGPLTTKARESIGNVIATTPQQRALIAVGDCAINGCVFADSPAYDGSAATAFDVHVEIEGCPLRRSPSSTPSARRRISWRRLRKRASSRMKRMKRMKRTKTETRPAMSVMAARMSARQTMAMLTR